MAPTKRKPDESRGPGRPPLQHGEETVPVTLRMTEGQRDKLARLGGPKWVRAKIDQAREPIEKPAPQGD